MSASSSSLRIPTPEAFLPLLEPKRFKGAAGGRGSAKSHFFGGLLVEDCIRQHTRAACVREVQNSIKDSVKQLIEDKISAYGVSHLFRVTEREITGPNDSLIIFRGLQNHTAASIKSLEGFNRCWVEEAQTISQKSLDYLTPTFRSNSELYFSWNPETPEDPVDRLFIENEGDPDFAFVRVTFKDNPWFPSELRKDMERDRANDIDKFGHVWLGQYLTISEAVIFKNRVSIKDFEAPEDTRFYFGADWGFANDPTVLMRCWMKDDCLYVDHEAYGVGVEIDHTPALFDKIAECRRWPIKADNARPETISYMGRSGFSISGAEKWKGSVEDGIAYLKGFKQIYIHPRCVNMQREARLYSYKVDKHTNDILPVVEDRENHCWDALRYALDGYIKGRRPMKISDDLLRMAATPSRLRKF